MRYAWPKLDVRFAVRNSKESLPPDLEDPQNLFYGPHRTRPSLLNKHPVDLLVIEKGSHGAPISNLSPQPWEEIIQQTSPANQPTVVIEAWQSSATLWRHGPTSKAVTARWRDLGYDLYCKKVNATQIGGAIDQERLLVIRLKRDSGFSWHRDQLDRDLSVIRPMGNLLVPPGLISRKAYLQRESLYTPKATIDPMPHQAGALIETANGVRRLKAEELARGLGISKGSEKGIGVKSLGRTTSVYHWEYMSFSLQHLDSHSPS